MDADTNDVVNITWSHLQQDIDKLCKNLSGWARVNPKAKIVAIARGGLIPATMISHQLDIPIHHVLFAKTYRGKENLGQTRIQELAAIPQKMVRDCIFVDDILDTGGTITQVMNKYPDAKFVIPYAKKKGLALHHQNLIVQPIWTYVDSDWVKFPWEKEEV